MTAGRICIPLPCICNLCSAAASSVPVICRMHTTKWTQRHISTCSLSQIPWYQNYFFLFTSIMFLLKKREILDYVRRKSWRKTLPKYMSKNIQLPIQLYAVTVSVMSSVTLWPVSIWASWINLWLWYTLYSILLHKELYVIISLTYIFNPVCIVLGTLMHIIIQHFDIWFSSQWALAGRDWCRDKLFNEFSYVAGLLFIHDKQMVAQQPWSVQYSRNK